RTFPLTIPTRPYIMQSHPIHKSQSVVRAPQTLIIGAGIIGLSTAYYLACATLESHQLGRLSSSSQIVVVEQASKVCSAASGQCEGALGEFGFPSDTCPLAKLSYKLHKQLAAEHGK